ncbi:hypothetical protein MSAN_02133500 [Mycena sanguinolenta]|uniref:Uncharacterized protein n=1 Tax=Mycena sanguinolenta TaxID=230812 RepID=A0A8H7CMD5_9AGAR|nr:hypothetical protein MSAN_02133500 [Mycena sanguinolenta]
MLFNDDLIHLTHFLDCYRDSHFSMVYIFVCCNQDFTEAINYLHSAFQQPFDSSECTSWIRRSNGRLCTELIPASDDLPFWWNPPELPGLLRMYPFSAETITMFIESLTLEQYHNICACNLGQYRSIALSTDTIINMGAVFRCPGNQLEDSAEIAFFAECGASLRQQLDDSRRHRSQRGHAQWLDSSGDVFTTNFYLSLNISSNWYAWLSQANYIFRRLPIMSNFDEYVDSEGKDVDADMDSDYNSANTKYYELEYSPTSACDDFEVDAESLDNQETVNWGPEHTEIVHCKKHDTSESTVEEDMVAEEIFVPSWSSNVLMIIQLVLIIFLGLSWLYDHVAVSFV